MIRQLRAAVTGGAAALVALGTATAALAGPAVARPSASPSASPSVSPSPRLDAKKGVTVWGFNGVDRALAKSGASWYYTWGVDHPGIDSPRGVHFVPMIWGAGSMTTGNLRKVRREGHYLLGFNEPDNPGQSNMAVSQALNLWPRLIATNMNLGSPAVSYGGATPGGWLDRFMRGARARHYRVNFVTVHWYGSDFRTRAAVGELESYLKAVHARYKLPIWLTEFALMKFGSTVTFPTARRQAAFLTAATSMLQHLSYVQRYAWFALPAGRGDASAGLFRPGAIATAAGRAFEAVGR